MRHCKYLIALMLSMSAFGQAEDCVTYDYTNSYIDEYGFMVLRFQNPCEDERWVNLCIHDANGKLQRFTARAPSKGHIDINVGIGIPSQTFHWTDDGSDPCNK